MSVCLGSESSETTDKTLSSPKLQLKLRISIKPAGGDSSLGQGRPQICPPPRISSQPCQLINANGGLFVGKLHTKGLITSHLHFFSNNLQYFLFKSQPNLLFYEMKKNLWAVSHNKSRE